MTASLDPVQTSILCLRNVSSSMVNNVKTMPKVITFHKNNDKGDNRGGRKTFSLGSAAIEGTMIKSGWQAKLETMKNETFCIGKIHNF